ncbi:hypothetical protein V8E54_008515 [Elaphomyces granulatus]
MARHSGKKKNGLEGNEFLFSGKKFRVSVPEGLHVLKDHDDQRLVKAQACWGSFRVFIPYNAIIDPKIDCLALVNKPIASKACNYRVADIIHLPAWKNGAMVMPRLKVDDQERENVTMLIADLGAKCDMVFGRQWLKEYYAPLADRLSVNKNSDDEIPDRKNPPASMSPPLETHEDTLILKTSAPALEKLAEPLGEQNRLSDKRSEEDSCQPRVRLPKAKVSRPHINNPSTRVAEAPIITSKEDWIALDEDTIVRPTVRCPGYMDRDLSALREEIDELLHELNEEDTCRSRIPITDNQSFQPLVRLSRNYGVRRYRSDNSYTAGIPEAPVTASRDRITMDEDSVAVLRVRLPGNPHIDTCTLSLFPSCGVNVKEELPCCLPAIDHVQDSFTEATWNKVLDDKSSESDALDNISNDKGNPNSHNAAIAMSLDLPKDDTGWSFQFIRMKFFEWNPRFLHTIAHGLILFSRILSLRILANFVYRPFTWFDTGWSLF